MTEITLPDEKWLYGDYNGDAKVGPAAAAYRNK